MHFALGVDPKRLPLQTKTPWQRDGTAELENGAVFIDIVHEAIEGRMPLDQRNGLKQRRAAPERRPPRNIAQRRHFT
jgi:hypothetical protein